MNWLRKQNKLYRCRTNSVLNRVIIKKLQKQVILSGLRHILLGNR